MTQAYSLRTFRSCIEKLEDRFVLDCQGTDVEPVDDLVSLASLVATDRFENNDSFAASADLGSLSGGTKTYTSLTMDDASDYYKFKLASNGTANTKVFVTLLHSQGDLDIAIYNANGVQVRNSDSLTDQESISLNGLAAGTYYIRVYGYRGAQNPNYKLTLTTTGSTPTPIGPTTPNPPATPNPTIDLVGVSLTASDSSYWGSTINVSARVSNLGTSSAGAFNVQYYLSRDNFVSSDDVLLAQSNGSSSATISSVAAGSTSSLLTSTVVLPSSLPSNWTGEFFYVVMKTDSAGQIAESNEANNAGQAGISLDWEPISIFAVNPTNPTNPGTSQFTITLNITGMTSSQRQIFQNAANRWSQIIVGDLPNQNFNGVAVDDVLIDASAQAIDGVGGILGQAGPDRLRQGTYLPYHGGMEFDSADLAAMERNGTLQSVIMHEMGHVLGIGTIWDLKGLLVGEGTSNPRFIGANATAAYNQLFGQTDTGVPVENSGGNGTRDSHWRESIMNRELMTGWAESSGAMPLSRITAGSLADLGYVVNMNAADSFLASASTLGAVVSVAGSTSSSLLSGSLISNRSGCNCSLCAGMVSAAQFDQAKENFTDAISKAAQDSQFSLATKNSQPLEKVNLGSRLSIVARDSLRAQHVRAANDVFASETAHLSLRSAESSSDLSVSARKSTRDLLDSLFASEIASHVGGDA